MPWRSRSARRWPGCARRSWISSRGRGGHLIRRSGLRVRGKAMAGFAAFQNHLSYLPHSGPVFPQLKMSSTVTQPRQESCTSVSASRSRFRWPASSSRCGSSRPSRLEALHPIRPAASGTGSEQSKSRAADTPIRSRSLVMGHAVPRPGRCGGRVRQPVLDEDRRLAVPRPLEACRAAATRDGPEKPYPGPVLVAGSVPRCRGERAAGPPPVCGHVCSRLLTDGRVPVDPVRKRAEAEVTEDGTAFHVTVTRAGLAPPTRPYHPKKRTT
jgi:hypothetical protein